MSPRKKATNHEAAQPQEAEMRATANPARPQRSEAVISPTPRAKPKEEDPFVRYDAGMRRQAAVLYRAMQQGPVTIMSIPEAMPEVVRWMRNRGVRIKARLTAGPTVYELEEAPEAVKALAL